MGKMLRGTTQATKRETIFIFIFCTNLNVKYRNFIHNPKIQKVKKRSKIKEIYKVNKMVVWIFLEVIENPFIKY